MMSAVYYAIIYLSRAAAEMTAPPRDAAAERRLSPTPSAMPFYERDTPFSPPRCAAIAAAAAPIRAPRFAERCYADA